MQRLPATVPQLVTASPSATEDGALLLGSHRSSVYVVDARSGTLLRVLRPYTEQAHEEHHAGILAFVSTLLQCKQTPALLAISAATSWNAEAKFPHQVMLQRSVFASVLNCADEVVPAQLDLTNAVLLGRQDYTVRSIDAVLGQEKWKVTYAQLDVLATPRLAVPASVSSDHLLPPSASEAVHAGTLCYNSSCCLVARFVARCDNCLSPYMVCRLRDVFLRKFYNGAQ